MASSPADRTGPDGSRRRRLRAVFAADVSNFGGLVSIDETKTLDSLWTMRRLVLKELEAHGGWLFGMPGDGIFALFESAVEAVRCALQAQASLAADPLLNALRLRIGVHLGEVLFQDDVPFGESLVIAARLESLAEPGSILVSAAVMEAVAPRIPATFVERGVRTLKHSPRMIATFSVLPPPPRDRPPEPRPVLEPATPDPPRSSQARSPGPDDTLAAPLAAGLGPAPAPDAAAAPAQGHPARVPALAAPHDPAAGPPALSDPAPVLHDPPPVPPDPAPQPDMHLPRATPLVLPSQPAPPHPPAPAARPGPPDEAPGVRYPETFLRELTLLLTTHVGPFARVLVRETAEAAPTAAALVQALAAEIPAQAERASFVASAQDLVRRLG